jgi:hypothetical protein
MLLMFVGLFVCEVACGYVPFVWFVGDCYRSWVCGGFGVFVIRI